MVMMINRAGSWISRSNPDSSLRKSWDILAPDQASYPKRIAAAKIFFQAYSKKPHLAVEDLERFPKNHENMFVLQTYLYYKIGFL